MPDHPASHLLILLSAPSGAGKTTLCQRLLATQSNLVRAVTSTTRPPRPGERDGVDYHFLSRERFEASLAAGHFLEHALVHDHLYGIQRSELTDRLRSAQDVIINIDVQGAATLRAHTRNDPFLAHALVTIFLAPPSLPVLRQRLVQRGTDSPEVIARRLAAAHGELAHWRHFDYLVVSASIDEDLRRMQVILEAERLRSHRSNLPFETS